jgi:hypothetical protein
MIAEFGQALPWEFGYGRKLERQRDYNHNGLAVKFKAEF